MENKKIKCKECEYYRELDTSCGLCRLWIPNDRVHCDSSCKNAKQK